jgi:hypothetical protein
MKVNALFPSLLTNTHNNIGIVTRFILNVVINFPISSKSDFI